MSALYCPQCGAPQQDGDRFCGSCGAKIPQIQKKERSAEDVLKAPPVSFLPVSVSEVSPKSVKRSFMSSPLLWIGMGLLLVFVALVFTLFSEQDVPQPELVTSQDAGNNSTRQGNVRSGQQPVDNANTTVTGKPIDVPHNGWIFTEPSTDYADLPALMANTDFSPDTNMGQLVFVCQKGQPSADYFALLVAPMFKHGDSIPVTLAIEGSDAALSLHMRDLYASKGGSRPKIDWDSNILFAPVAMEDLGELIQANALLVSAAGESWRLVGGNTLKQSGEGFLAQCEGGK